MRYATQFLIQAAPTKVFAALHRYKIARRPNDFFMGKVLGRIANMGFEVITDHTLGLGATYAWDIRLLGIPVLQFQEQVVEWQEGKCVAYQAVKGWKMFFRAELEPQNDGTRAKFEIVFSFGITMIDLILRPIVEMMLRTVCRGLVKRGLASQEQTITQAGF